jgi:hypothetical protein
MKPTLAIDDTGGAELLAQVEELAAFNGAFDPREPGKGP